jgi:transcriptional regulator with XRE-family HTH domain
MKYDKGILVDNINKLLADNHITVTKLADIAGVAQSRASILLEKEDPSQFKLPQLVAVADYFNVSVDYLLGIDKESKGMNVESLADIAKMILALRERINVNIEADSHYSYINLTLSDEGPVANFFSDYEEVLNVASKLKDNNLKNEVESFFLNERLNRLDEYIYSGGFFVDAHLPFDLPFN